jgi:DNA polymerase III epsilon subunit-like protein
MKRDLDALCRRLGIDRRGRTGRQLLEDPEARRKLEAALRDRELAPLVAALEADARGLLHKTTPIH